MHGFEAQAMSIDGLLGLTWRTSEVALQVQLVYAHAHSHFYTHIHPHV